MSWSRLSLFGLVAASLLGGCQATDYALLLEVYSQEPLEDVTVRVLSLDQPRTPHMDTSARFNPVRTPEDLQLSPARMAVVLEGPALILVHVTGRTPSGEVVVATRCYALSGVIEDDIMLVALGAEDLDGDTFVVNPDLACREPTPDGAGRACGELDYVCPADRASDCEDTDATRFPGAPFICQNGIDEDCDGIDEPCGDQDEDGFEACAGDAMPGCDCDDTNALINPGAIESSGDASVCLDGIDQNCDGSDVCCDLDGDGYTHCGTARPNEEDCIDDPSQCPAGVTCTPSAIGPGASEAPAAGSENCDGIDNDCNGAIDDHDLCRGPDLDGDGVAHCGREIAGDPCDCNDCDAGIFVGAREICGNGVDEDCDGVDTPCDPADTDGDGQVAPADCDDTDPFAHGHAPGEPVHDLCGNAIAATCVPGEDRACTGDLDGDGYVEPTMCEGDASVGPLVAETCNGIDDDCDGASDEVFDATNRFGCVVPGARVDYFVTDTLNCGGCRVVCPAGVTDVCDAGQCDCSSDPGIGACENDPSGVPATEPFCCGSGCVDLDDDLNNCGRCGNVCGAGETCSGGECTCGTVRADGAEACPETTPGGTQDNQCCGAPGAEICTRVSDDDANCGQCGLACGAHSTCGGPGDTTPGFCACDAPTAAEDWRDCNNDRGMLGNNGCEVEVRSRVDHCGSCGSACDLFQADEVCSAGTCQIASCVGTFNDCDTFASSGCEADFTSVASCGACGARCGTSESCTSMRCRCGVDAGALGAAACTGAEDTCCLGTGDCVDTDNDVNNCGGCGVRCDPDETCSSGRCNCNGQLGTSVGSGPVCRAGSGSPVCGGSGCVRCLNDTHCGAANPQCVATNCRLCDSSDDAGCGGATAQCLSNTSCVQCIDNSNCGGATTQCEANVCRFCNSANDAGCGGPTPQCLGSASCVQCIDNTHCGGATPQCVSNVCRRCNASNDAGCASPTGQCLAGTSCVQCIADGDCPGTTQCVANSCQLCDPADDGGCASPTGQCLSGTSCVQCIADGDCPGSQQCVANSCQVCDTADDGGCGAPTPQCLGGTSCVACLGDGDCAGTTQCVANSCQLCDTADDAGCGAPTPQCRSGTSCVECLMDGHCPGTEQCVANSCQLCDAGDDAGCAAPTPVCVGGTVCVGCVTDGDCGGTTPQCVAGACEACDTVGDAGCSGTTPQCKPVVFTCVECLDNADCTSGPMMCNTGTNVCQGG